MRGHTEIQNFNRQDTLNAGGITKFSKDFELGEGWLMMLLTVSLAITAGTAASPVVDGVLACVKNILLKSDKDGEHVNGSGRACFLLGYAKSGCIPLRDDVAATDGTYRASIPLFFSNPFLARPNDSILDTSRYNKVELHITLGTIADLFGTPGTATLDSAKIDIEVVRTRGALPKNAVPLVYPYQKELPQVNPANQTYIDIERSPNLSLLALIFQTANSVTSGIGFSGTVANNVIDRASIEDNVGAIMNERPEHAIRQQNQINHHIQSMTGQYCYNFVMEGSVFGAYSTGDKTRCQLKWVNDTLSTSGVTAMIDGLKAITVR